MAETRCCQCGRTGTRGLRTFPNEDAVFDGVVIVPAHSMAECTGKIACRRRTWRQSGGAAGHAERMRAYE